MFFKKNKPAPQPEAQKMPSLQPSDSEGHSLFAPTINPMPGAIDFGFGQIQTTHADNRPAMAAAEVLTPLPQAEPAPWEQPSYEPTPLPWESEPLANGFEQTAPVTTSAQAMPLISPELSPEQAWEAMSPDFPLPQQAAPLDAWEPAPATPEFAQPEATQPYLGETFENYLPQPAYQPEAPIEPQPGFVQATAPDLFEQFEQPFQSDMPETFTPIPLEPTADFTDNPIDFTTVPPFQAAEKAEATRLDDLTHASSLEFDAFASSQDFAQPGSGFTADPQAMFSAEADTTYLFEESPIPQAEGLLWNNLNTSQAMPGEQVPLDPAAFLDSINQQLYPADPLQSVHPELNESEQAFEEAAQFLFPETMGAALDWSTDNASESFFPNTTLDSPEMAGFDEEASFDLGASFQTETSSISEISSLMGEAPEDMEEEDAAPIIADLSEFQITPGSPPDAYEQSTGYQPAFSTADDGGLEQAFEEAAPHFQEADLTAFLGEPATSSTHTAANLLETAPYNPSGIPDATASHTGASSFQNYATDINTEESRDIVFSDEDDEEDAPTYDFSAYASTLETIQFPSDDESTGTMQGETYQAGPYRTVSESGYSEPISPYSESYASYSTNEEADTDFAAWPSFTTDDELTSTLEDGSETLSYDLSLSPADLAIERTETLLTASYGLSSTGQEEPDHLQASAASPDYTEEDTWFNETEIPTNISGNTVAEPENSPIAFAAEPSFESDEDFYATAFTLNEQGELVPTDAPGQPIPYIPAASPSTMPAPIQTSVEAAFVQPTPIEEPPAASREPAAPEPLSVALEEESLLEFASFDASSADMLNMGTEPSWEEAPALETAPPKPQAGQLPTSNEPIPPAETMTPMQMFEDTEIHAAQRQPPVEPMRRPEVQAPAKPEQQQPPEMPLSANAPIKPFTAAQAQQPKPSAAQNQPHYQDELEAQWHSSPVEPRPRPAAQKAPLPNVASELMLGNLEVLSVCSLNAEKRLLVVHNKGIFALMGQYGMEQPQISVLKVFEHNPIAYQNTFTAVEEGQAGSQGMFVVQVGTWHAIISTFQDKISLHTELG